MVAHFDTMREVWVDVPVGPTPITYAQFVTHARRFGTTCVLETAIEMGLPPAQVARLRIECDETDRDAKANRWRPKTRRTAVATTTAVRALASEGLATGEIATKLGISEKRVLNVKGAVTGPNAPRISRGFLPTKRVPKAAGHRGAEAA